MAKWTWNKSHLAHTSLPFIWWGKICCPRVGFLAIWPGSDFKLLIFNCYFPGQPCPAKSLIGCPRASTSSSSLRGRNVSSPPGWRVSIKCVCLQMLVGDFYIVHQNNLCHSSKREQRESLHSRYHNQHPYPTVFLFIFPFCGGTTLANAVDWL